MARIASYRGVFAGRRRSSRAGERGSTIVEFALLLPVFSLMLFGMIQFGLAFYGWDAVHNAVQAGARLAAIGQTEYSSDGSSCTYTGTNPTPFAVNTVPAEFAVAVADGGPTDTTTGALYCQILYEIGTPPGTNLSSTQPAEVNITLSAVGTTGSTVTVCANIQAQTFTGFFPSIGLSSSSEFYVEDSGVQTYAPYGGGTCPTTPTLAMKSAPSNYTIGSFPPPTSTVNLSNSGANSTGTITFWVYDSSSPPTACSPGAGAPWYEVGTSNTQGDNTYQSPNFDPTQAGGAGTYWWYATYSSGAGGAGAATNCGSSMLSTVVT